MSLTARRRVPMVRAPYCPSAVDFARPGGGVLEVRLGAGGWRRRSAVGGRVGLIAGGKVDPLLGSGRVVPGGAAEHVAAQLRVIARRVRAAELVGHHTVGRLGRPRPLLALFAGTDVLLTHREGLPTGGGLTTRGPPRGDPR